MARESNRQTKATRISPVHTRQTTNLPLMEEHLNNRRMKRLEIRVWDGKEMHYPDTNYAYELTYTRSAAWQLWFNKEKLVAQQFDDGVDFMLNTNLKDKNGKFIYEGDILDFDEREWGGKFHPDVVVWEDLVGEWQLCGSISDLGEWRQVIGNIYENPELL